MCCHSYGSSYACFKISPKWSGEHTHYTVFGKQYVDFSKSKYEYDKMPLNGNEKSYEKSKLLYDCGIAMKMNYTQNGQSAAVLRDAIDVMPKHFKYERSMFMMNWQGEDVFLYMLKREISTGKPIFLSAKEHAFFTDGYDGNLLHLNLGSTNENGVIIKGYYKIGERGFVTSTTGFIANVLTYIKPIDTFPFVNDFESNYDCFHLAGNMVSLSSKYKCSGEKSFKMSHGKIYQKLKIPENARNLYLSFKIMNDGTEANGSSTVLGYLTDTNGIKLIDLGLNNINSGLKTEWKEVSVNLDKFTGKTILLHIEHKSKVHNYIYIDDFEIGNDYNKYGFLYAYVTEDFSKIIVEFNKKINFNRCNNMNFRLKINGATSIPKGIWSYGQKGTEIRLTLSSFGARIKKGDDIQITYQNYTGNKILNPETEKAINDIANPIKAKFEPRSITSIKNISNTDLKLYPNPASNYIKCNKHIKILSIYNLYGKLILQIKNIDKNKEIDISNFNTGVYLVKIKTLDGEMKMLKLNKTVN